MEINGTTFEENTPNKVAEILNKFMHTGKRLRIFYGDENTGKDWLEIFDTRGTIGRSTGTTKVPLIIATSRSLGGPAILTNHIVKITADKKVLYKHPKYHLPTLTIKDGNLYADGEEIYTPRNNEKAMRFMAYLKGERNNY